MTPGERRATSRGHPPAPADHQSGSVYHQGRGSREKGGPLESLVDALKTMEAECRKLRADLSLVEAEIAARRPTVLTPQEVADLLGEMRKHLEAEDALELRAILRLVIERVTVDGQDYQIHYKPEARPWFTT